MGQSVSYSWDQVKLHGYIVAKGKVYDLPRFILEHGNDGHHPVEKLRQRAGQDCTNDFIHHGRHAKSKWKRYYLGRVMDPP